MQNMLLVIETIIALLLVGAILLQPPKGEGLGAIGGQARLFKSSSRDLNAGITRFTGILAISFYILAFILGVLI